MNSTSAKRVALLASFGAGAATAAGAVINDDGKIPMVAIAVATFGLAALTTAVAEVAPQLAAGAALTVLVTALFTISDAPWQAVGNISSVTAS